MDIYFILWVKIHSYINLLGCSSSLALAIWSSSMFVPVSFDMTPSFEALPYFFGAKDTPSSSCTFPSKALESATYPRIPWTMVFKHQVLG